MSYVSVICCMLAFLMTMPVSAEMFPPQESGYMGDYIVITAPGKYTLERDLHHSYPVGIVILSSSVVISGNGYTISPSGNEPETVGVWIAAYDSQGMPITGVTLQDLQIEDETYGVFIEGESPSPFSWAADIKPEERTRQSLPTHMMNIVSVTISDCASAITISEGIGVRIDDVYLHDNEYGITASGKDLTITNSVITKNTKAGILLEENSEASLSQNTITENTIGVETRGNSRETLTDIDNVYKNQKNIVSDIKVNQDTQSAIDISFSFPLTQVPFPISTGEEDAGEENGEDASPLDSISVPTPEPVPLPTETQLTQVRTIPPTPLMTLSQPLFPSPTSAPTVSPSLVPFTVPSPAPSPTPQNTEVDLSKNLITGTHATIVSDTIPDTLTPGSRTLVSLTVANTGSTVWKQDDGIGVSAVGDTARYAPAWQPVPVKTNEKRGEYTLEFSITAPPTSGKYNFSFQVGKKRSDITSTFGRPYTKTVLIS